MKYLRALFFVSLFSISGILHAQKVQSEPLFNLSNISVANLSAVIFGEAMKAPYILSPDVVADERLTSFRSPGSNLTAFLELYFDNLGYRYSIEKGIHLVVKKQEHVQAIKKEELKQLVVYQPIHRPASYLNQILKQAFGGSLASIGGYQGVENQNKNNIPIPPGSIASFIDSPADVVLLRDTSQKIKEIELILTQIDTPTHDLDVQSLVFEFTKNKGDGSALSVAGSILSGRFGITVDGVNQGSSLSIKFGDFSAVASILDSDSRYKLVSRPSIRVRSGTKSLITVGQDVPVIGSVVVAGTGAPVRSIDYKHAGTTLSISPTLRSSGLIDLDVTQTLSNAFITDTGVNESPTISKREINSSLTIKQNEFVALGGLIERKSNSSSRGLFGTKFSNQDGASDVEYLVFLMLKESS